MPDFNGKRQISNYQIHTGEKIVGKKPLKDNASLPSSEVLLKNIKNVLVLIFPLKISLTNL